MIYTCETRAVEYRQRGVSRPYQQCHKKSNIIILIFSIGRVLFDYLYRHAIALKGCLQFIGIPLGHSKEMVADTCERCSII